LPAYDNLGSSNAHVGGWSDFYNDGDEAIMRDEAYRVAGELGITDHSLPVAERIQRIAEWMGRQDSTTTPFQWSGKKDGYVYDCTTRSRGAVSLFKLAGVPAVSISMTLRGELHEEPFFYDEDGKVWMHADYIANNSSSEKTFTEFFERIQTNVVDCRPLKVITTDALEDFYQLSVTILNPGTEVSSRSIDDYIFDIDETWINYSAESFMLTLLQQPYAYPDKKLTRGEVARLLCNYLGVVPMRNEQVFSDVPTSHRYSKYIWAINKLGIMNGDGDGTFRPDSELSMQEFAVMAMQIVEDVFQNAVIPAKKVIDEIQNNPTDWPPDSSYTKSVLKGYEERADWEARFANIPSHNPIIFADDDQIASWAKSAVSTLSGWGILEGDTKVSYYPLGEKSNSNLHPTEFLSKTRFLVFLYKFYKKLDISGGFGEPLF
ncbi:MAG: S-layer homology domain-containing protein, partial [Oscillospiraceae bacterium]|nr:S-layer homology domain-containing protein [Oscillospiraceae bacterium]